MHGLVGELPIAHRRLTRREKGESTTGTGKGDEIRQSQAALVSEAESAVCGALGILNPMAGEMDPVRVLHQREYFLDRSCGGLEEGCLCEWRVLDRCSDVFQLSMNAGKLGLAI